MAGITDIKAYTALGSDNKPRIIVHDSTGGIWLDDGVKKGTVGTGGLGCSLIPFRPNQSPVSWMYCGNSTGYDKVSAPDASNNCTFQKVGIAEPQAPPDACPDGFQYNEFTAAAASWTPAGTVSAGPVDVTRSSATVNAIFQDPASVSPVTKKRFSVRIDSSVAYQVGETLTFNKSGGGTISAEVEDVYPPISTGTTITIQSIFYFTGTTGLCIIVPSQMPVGGLMNPSDPTQPTTTTLPVLAEQLANLRRGSLVELQSGGEVVFVLDVTTGPQGQIAFECSTSGTHTAGETITGIKAICVSGISALVVGQTVTAPQINTVIQKGIGTITQTLSTNPFDESLGTIGIPQESDLLHVSLTTDLPGNITELKILFDIGDGSFTQNMLYFAVEASTLQQVVNNQISQTNAAEQLTNPQAIYQALVNAGYSPINAISTINAINSGSVKLQYDPTTGNATLQTANGHTIQLNIQTSTGVGQYTELFISLASLIRVGSDQTKTLANCTKVQILANVTAATVIGIGALWVGGGGQPDVGVNGSPYYYRLVPRSTLTGVIGNPSPATRYGVGSRKQPNIISLPSAAYDAQITNWDVYRYGGSVTSWRFIGTANSTATTFTDNFDDAAALAGSELGFDNFEPWPTVDVPFAGTAGSGGITSITVFGTAIVIIGTLPATVLRWLPGTLLTLDGQYTYTLWNRPVAVSGGILFRTLENAGAPTVTTLVVQEPDVANQILPYLWGPDANGIVFGVGDPLRPGALYSSKPNNPDATPNNVYDLTPPSEPLIGGMVIDGVSLVASSERWWVLQAALSTPQRWIPVEMPAGRGLVAPFAHCTDGKSGFMVAKDGVYVLAPNTAAINLTDADLGNIFPHDGVPGQNTMYGGATIFAPAYQYAADFRLGIVNDFLKFHYRDSSGIPRTLELDMSLDTGGQPRMAWSPVSYADPINNSYQPEQPSGTLITESLAYSQCYFTDTNGNVWIETEFQDDRGVPITVNIGTPEVNYGDDRVNKQWLDAMVDAIPVTTVGVSTVFNGSVIGTPQTIAPTSSRLQTLLALGEPLAFYLGLLFSWLETYPGNNTSSPTYLMEWSSECVAQPVMIRTWKSVPTSHGVQGYHHVGRIRFAYMTVDANPVTLTLTAFDGVSPTVLTLPGTNGAYQKTEFVPTFNKGLLYTYEGTHPTGWSPIVEDCEILVGSWQRSGPYAVFTGLGGVEAQ